MTDNLGLRVEIASYCPKCGNKATGDFIPFTFQLVSKLKCLKCMHECVIEIYD